MCCKHWPRQKRITERNTHIGSGVLWCSLNAISSKEIISHGKLWHSNYSALRKIWNQFSPYATTVGCKSSNQNVIKVQTFNWRVFMKILAELFKNYSDFFTQSPTFRASKLMKQFTDRGFHGQGRPAPLLFHHKWSRHNIRHWFKMLHLYF